MEALVLKIVAGCSLVGLGRGCVLCGAVRRMQSGERRAVAAARKAQGRRGVLDLANGDGWSVAAGLLGRGTEVAERRVGDAVGFEVQGGGVVGFEAFHKGF